MAFVVLEKGKGKKRGARRKASITFRPTTKFDGYFCITPSMHKRFNEDLGETATTIIWKADEENRHLLLIPSTSTHGQKFVSTYPNRMLVQMAELSFMQRRDFVDPVFRKKLGGYVLDFSKE